MKESLTGTKTTSLSDHHPLLVPNWTGGLTNSKGESLVRKKVFRLFDCRVGYNCECKSKSEILVQLYQTEF